MCLTEHGFCRGEKCALTLMIIYAGLIIECMVSALRAKSDKYCGYFLAIVDVLKAGRNFKMFGNNFWCSIRRRILFRGEKRWALYKNRG